MPGNEQQLMKISNKKQLIIHGLQREDQLNNSRLSWLLSFQGFLFASFSFLYTQTDKNEEFLLPIILLGAISAGITWALVVTSLKAIERLHILWEKYESDLEVTPFGIQKARSGYLFHAFGLSHFLPLACVISWGYIGFKNILSTDFQARAIVEGLLNSTFYGMLEASFEISTKTLI